MRIVNEKSYGYLVLDKENSIVLPYFDTSIISREKISEIILSLFVVDRKSKSDNPIQITVNPFNPESGDVEDGLSTFINPRIGYYTDFHLQKDSFEKILGTKKRLLIKLVNDDSKIVFSGIDDTGTSNDPKLVITSEGGIEPSQIPVSLQEVFNNLGSINNSQLNFGPGNNIININHGPKEGFWSKFFWQVIVAIFVGLISFLFLL